MPAAADGNEAESETEDETRTGDEAEGKLQQYPAHHYRGAGESCDGVKIGTQHRGYFANENIPGHAATDAGERTEQDRGDGRRAPCTRL